MFKVITVLAAVIVVPLDKVLKTQLSAGQNLFKLLLFVRQGRKHLLLRLLFLSRSLQTEPTFYFPLCPFQNASFLLLFVNVCQLFANHEVGRY